MRNIYRKTVDVHSDIEPNLFNETLDIFSRAVASGISDAVNSGDDMPRDEFLYQVKHNVQVFSAFRTHRMQNDIAARMLDDEGKLRSFSQFRKAVEGYTDHQNRAWLQTEYTTAVRRAHQAADWQQFEAEKDVLPNLEWIPSTSPTPGADHRVFWNTILPIDSKFWDEHRPGDRWNCKCDLRNTDKEPTATPVSSSSKDDPAPGLTTNPGKKGEVFSQDHPYYPTSCSTCPFAGNRLMALFADLKGGRKHCNACGKVDNKIEKATSSDVTALLKKLHTAKGTEYNQTLQEICQSKIFKPMAEMKGVYWTGSETDFDLDRLKAAAKKAVSFGNKVYMLPNPNSTRSADFIFVKKGIYKDYDLKTVVGKGSVGDNLMSSIGQTRRVLLNMTTDYNPRSLASDIKRYFEANKNATEVLIYKSKRQISIHKELANHGGFIKEFISIWNKQK